MAVIQASTPLGSMVTSIVVGNALDYRENNRFRLEVAPVILVLGAVGAELILRRRADRRATRV